MAHKELSERFDLWGNPSCVVCGKPIVQSGGRGRVRKYCNNACKMKERYRRFQDLVTRDRRQDTKRKRVKKLGRAKS